MRLQTSMLVGCLLLVQSLLCFASAPVTLPAETVQNMKKGKKLDLVWTAPGFDGTKGVRLGLVTNETERSTEDVQSYVPSALSRVIKPNSPYILHLAVVELRLNSTPATTRAYVEVEGRILDSDEKLVGAFTAHGEASIGGNASDNVRLATNAIAFALTKDLFSAALPVDEKSSASIVPAPAPKSAAIPVPASPTGTGLILPAPTGMAKLAQGNSPSSSAPPAAPLPQAQPIEPLAVPAAQPPVVPPAQAVEAVPAAVASFPVPSAPQPETQPVVPAAPVLFIPEAIKAGMKRGSRLGHVWIAPAYDRKGGFALGEVRYQVAARNDGIDKFLPDALAGIANKDAACSLQLDIVQLDIRRKSTVGSSVFLGVQGRVTAQDGTILAAFESQEKINGIGDSVDDCRQAARAVVLGISKDLK